MHAIFCRDECPIWLVTSDQHLGPNAVQLVLTLVTLEACAIHYPTSKTIWDVLVALVLR